MRYDEYKGSILNNDITPREIMKKIKMPSSVFKYRCIAREKDGEIIEDPYWKESMNGSVFFLWLKILTGMIQKIVSCLII